MNNERTAYALAFNCLTKLRYHQLQAILEYFNHDLAAAWHAADKWAEIARLPAVAAAELLRQRATVDAERLYRQYQASGFSLVTRYDKAYPASLANIYDPPLLLFYLGQLPGEDELCLAMIGSRQATPYGLQVAELLARDLAAQGLVIVSGLARGIDSCSHRGALAAPGRTIAVLGSGLDVIYPAENAKLYGEISRHGAVISELPLGAGPLRHHFPQRNRIISGLCQAVLVVEAGEKSGALLTVDYALEQGRDVFAVPGNITSPTSRGVNQLIKNGATPVNTAADVWQVYSDRPFRRAKPAEQPPESAPEGQRQLLELLRTPHRVDEIDAAQLKLDVAALAAQLTLLEIQGQIRQLPGGYYQTKLKTL